MNENEFELNGRWYAARDTDGVCEGCAFEGDKTGCDSTPPCSTRRSDGRNVIYVEAPKPEPKTNGDRIRGMSNEELAATLQNIVTSSVTCILKAFNIDMELPDGVMADDLRRIKDWLNSPAEAGSEEK